MKKILFIASILLVSFNVFSQKIHGVITNPESETIFILNKHNNVVFSAKVSLDDGSFSGTFKKPVTPGFYTLKYSHETSNIYLKPSYDLEITLDTKAFDETIHYRGQGADNNNFLAKKFLLEEKGYGNLGKLYAANESDFLKKINTVKQKEDKLLSRLTDTAFANIERRNCTYSNLRYLIFYPTYHAYLTHNDSFKVSETFMAPLDSIDYDNESDFVNSKDYQNLAYEYYITPIRSTNDIKAVILKIEHIKSKVIKEAEKNNLLKELSPSIKNPDAINDAIQNYMSDDDFKKKVNAKVEAVKKVAPGQPSPLFSYKDIDGKPLSLSDLKGKVVYIDVWATWCSPCRREIPFLKKMAKAYEGKPIAFVSISVDNKSAYDKWKKMVKTQTSNWHQLFADKSWNSDFVRAYMINSIPRFILIDKDGTIVSPDATRPSNTQTSKTIDDLLAK